MSRHRVWSALSANDGSLRSHFALLAGRAIIILILFLIWHVLSVNRIIPPFFFGEPVKALAQIWRWISSNSIYEHLGVTLIETILSLIFGLVFGLLIGLWFGLSRMVSLLCDPILKAINSMPRVILGPIFILWFGLGIWSKVALGFTLVFFIVFFNVYQGVREVNPTVLANARVLGANARQLILHVYVPSATSWVFSSLHTSVGMAFVGAVVGEYLGSSRGIGFLILQAEGMFDINAVLAGMLILTAFALLLDGLVTFLEKRLVVWRPH